MTGDETFRADSFREDQDLKPLISSFVSAGLCQLQAISPKNDNTTTVVRAKRQRLV